MTLLALTAPVSAPAAPLFESLFRAHVMGPPLDYLEAADLNGDSQVDLVGVASSAGIVVVAIAEASGGFGEAQVYAVSGGRSEPVIADLTGDGNPDVAIADSPNTTVGILAGLGDGTFEDTLRVEVGFQCYTVAAADMNADTKLDLVAANWASVAVLLGNGDGTFGAAVSYPTASNAYRITIGDLNGDSAPDVVTGNDYSQVSVLLNNGDGTLTDYQGYPTGNAIGDIEIADATGDGIPDVVIPGNNKVIIMPGDGSGAFLARADIDLPSPVARVGIGDLDADTNPDLVLVGGSQGYSPVGNEIFILRGDGAGGYPGRSRLESIYFTRDVSLADVDGDGALDLVVAGSDGHAALHPGRGDGTFGSSLQYSTGADPVAMSLGDLDGDGFDDLVVGHRGSASIGVRKGLGDGTFGLRMDYESNLAYPIAVAAGDLTGDGRADVVVADAPDAATPGAARVAVFSGYSNGQFGSTDVQVMGIGLSGVAMGDLDDDGDNDLVVADAIANRASVLLNGGGGVFLPPIHYGAGAGATGVAIADVDGDTHPDIVTANRDAGSVTFLKGGGDGTVVTDGEFETALDCRAIAIGLLDGDLFPDIVTANGTSGTMSILYGLSGGGFAPAIALPTGVHPTTVVIAHLDEDAVPDLAFGAVGEGVGSPGAYTNLIGYARGVSGGDFAPPVLLGSGTQPQQVLAGDLDADGSAELLAANRIAETVTVFRHPTVVVAVEPQGRQTDLSMGPAWPNPSNAGISIRFELPHAGEATVRVFDVQGRLVRTLAAGRLPEGRHAVSWDRHTTDGTAAAPGVYLCELRTGGARLARRIVLL